MRNIVGFFHNVFLVSTILLLTLSLSLLEFAVRYFFRLPSSFSFCPHHFDLKINKLGGEDSKYNLSIRLYLPRERPDSLSQHSG